ncbi:NAD(+) diphosphatase [Mangrovibrevibacter kandeliae]|uniref:NAD(+) diphosphatase n=1 Tax=Mangrovibrevibacter kandeliae TaxID=2968473 RepID=UPI0021187F11|nr:NAD(+) diphosphatase [Aurantimonas sp. CSK15Z-1]MCQ8783469.1 NAD(+) diphosphatase [Aurantimonas sp. CSK15Z-1]
MTELRQDRPEISAGTGFAGNRLLRDGEHRTEETLATALADPRATVYLLHERQWFAHGDGAERLQPQLRVADLPGLRDSLADAVLLGHDTDGVPRLALQLEAAPLSLDGAIEAFDLRAAAMQGLFDGNVEGQLAQAAHLLNWHARSRFCGRCGAPTASEAAGYRRRCTRCGELYFPRTDPVAIMLVHDGAGHCILGRQPRFAENFWSCLAGFVEPGETLEDAVRRETLEEAGITVGRVDYLASQPWPFPGSLMLGCTAEATSLDVAFDGTELESCRWFARDEVRAMLAGEHPDGLMLPKPFAIAHHLVKAFADEAT